LADCVGVVGIGTIGELVNVLTPSNICAKAVTVVLGASGTVIILFVPVVTPETSNHTFLEISPSSYTSNCASSNVLVTDVLHGFQIEVSVRSI